MRTAVFDEQRFGLDHGATEVGGDNGKRVSHIVCRPLKELDFLSAYPALSGLATTVSRLMALSADCKE